MELRGLAWGVVAALPRELGPTLRALGARRDGGAHVAGRLILVAGGVGEARAAGAAAALADRVPLAGLVSTGYAGALLPGAHIGDVVVGGAPGRPAAERMLDIATRAAPSAPRGDVATVARVVLGREEKRGLAHAYGATVVDMEAAGVARVARARGLGFLSVKVVLDTLEEPLASTYERLTQVAGEVLRRPSLVRRMLGDAARARATAYHLATFYAALARVLAAEVPSATRDRSVLDPR